MVQCATIAMAIPPPGDLTQYRVTFFFGPEPVEDRPDHLRCVFNVKKRSWKGGVQVGVDLAQVHLDQARDHIGFASWLEDLLRDVEQEEREAATQRANDLFIQSLCTCALNLSLHAGLEQENQIIEASAFATELECLVREAPTEVTDRIRLELDLAEPSDLA